MMHRLITPMRYRHEGPISPRCRARGEASRVPGGGGGGDPRECACPGVPIRSGTWPDHVPHPYDLAHREDVDESLRVCDEQAEAIRRKIEASQRPGPSKEELLARAMAKGVNL